MKCIIKETVKCPCGNLVEVRSLSKFGRTKYCSKKCFYKFRKRKSGLKYNLKKENPTSFKKGIIPWNKNIMLGSRCKTWKGDDVGYDAIHEWVERWLGKPDRCDRCGTEISKRFDWANKSGKYLRDYSDWMRLCVKCHYRYDYEKFGLRKFLYEGMFR